jgi:hypothetical protein
MTSPAALGAGAMDRAQARGVWRAAGAYVFALLLLVALSWVSRPELAVLTSSVHQLIAVAGLVVAMSLAWFFPVETPVAPGDGVAALPPESIAPPMSDTAQASIAVMPLENLSGSADDALVA